MAIARFTCCMLPLSCGKEQGLPLCDRRFNDSLHCFARLLILILRFRLIPLFGFCYVDSEKRVLLMVMRQSTEKQRRRSKGICAEEDDSLTDLLSPGARVLAGGIASII